MTSRDRRRPSSPIGLHRVLEPAGVLPQAARRLDPTPEIWPDEVRVAVEVLNLDAASYRQLAGAHPARRRWSRRGGRARGGARDRRRAGQDAEPGHRLRRDARRHGGRGGSRSRPLGLAPGDRVATLVSLSLTPLRITDGLRRLGRPERAGPGRGRRRAVRPLDRRGRPRRPGPAALADGDGRLRRPGAGRPGRPPVRRGAAGADGGGHRGRGQVRVAGAGRRP